MKAVITAANPHHRNLPLQTLSDASGSPVPLLRLHLRDLEAAGITETAIIHHPDDETVYREAASSGGTQLTMIGQDEPRGFGDAVLRARDFAVGEPFVLIVCDHLFLSTDPERNCIRQLLDLYQELRRPVSAVQSTHESQVSSFGVVAGEPHGQQDGVFKVREVREKPTPTEAELHLRVAGNRSGYYLGFFGIHVLEADIFDRLDEVEELPLGLSPALHALARQGRLHAVLVKGDRFDLEAEYGLLQAQLAMALSGGNRETVLAHLVRILAGTKS